MSRTSSRDQSIQAPQPQPLGVILRHIEGKDDPVKMLKIRNNPLGFDSSSLRSSIQIELAHSELVYECTADLKDLDTWRRVGAGVGRSNTLQEFTLNVEPNDRPLSWGPLSWGPNPSRRNDNITTTIIQSISALINGAKHNTSINRFDLHVSTFETFHWIELLQNWQHLNELRLRSAYISVEQGRILAAALRHTSIGLLNLVNCRFESLEQVFQSCLNVTRLHVRCFQGSHFDSIAALLRNPNASLSELKVSFICMHRSNTRDYNEGLRCFKEGLVVVTTGLVQNTKLTRLEIDQSLPGGVVDIDMGPFRNVLCNMSSIDDIVNSNHSLKSIKLGGGGVRVVPIAVPEVITDLLELNKGTNKHEVIYKKLARYYFGRSFDVSLFATLPISVLPKVLGVFNGRDVYMRSLAFVLLRSIPEYADISIESDSKPSTGSD
jgi:hypothetical protein